MDTGTKTYFQFLNVAYAPKTRFFLLMFVLTGLSELTILAIPYLSGKAFDVRHESFTLACEFAGLMLATFLVRMFFITFIQDYVRITQLDYAIPREATHHVLSTLVKRGVVDKPEITMRIDSTGIRALCSLTDAFIFKVLPSGTRILFITVSMLFLSPSLSGLFTISAVVYMLIAWRRHHALFSWQKDLERQVVTVNAQRGDVHYSLTDAQQADESVQQWLIAQTALDEDRVQLALRGRAWDRFRNLPLRFGEVGILVLGIWLESQGIVTEGTLVACMLWARQGSQTLTSVGKLFAQFADEWAQVKNLAEICSAEE